MTAEWRISQVAETEYASGMQERIIIMQGWVTRAAEARRTYAGHWDRMKDGPWGQEERTHVLGCGTDGEDRSSSTVSISDDEGAFQFC